MSDLALNEILIWILGTHLLIASLTLLTIVYIYAVGVPKMIDRLMKPRETDLDRHWEDVNAVLTD